MIIIINYIMHKHKTIKKNKAMRKGGMAEVLKEERKEEKAMRAFRGSRHQAMKYADTLMQQAQQGVDTGYLRTILFPELYNADVPQPLST